MPICSFRSPPITSSPARLRTTSPRPWFSRQGTAIGAAIDLASQSFSSGSDGSRVIVIISDGENHEDDAIAAAKAAAEKGIKIYTIGIGSPEGAPIPIDGNFIKDEKRKHGRIETSTKRRSNRSPCRPEALTSAPRTAASDSTKSSRRSTKSRKTTIVQRFRRFQRTIPIPDRNRTAAATDRIRHARTEKPYPEPLEYFPKTIKPSGKHYFSWTVDPSVKPAKFERIFAGFSVSPVFQNPLPGHCIRFRISTYQTTRTKMYKITF